MFRRPGPGTDLERPGAPRTTVGTPRPGPLRRHRSADAGRPRPRLADVQPARTNECDRVAVVDAGVRVSLRVKISQLTSQRGVDVGDAGHEVLPRVRH